MKKIPGRALAATLLAVAASSAFCEAFPTQPIKLIVPQPAGSGSDAIVRLVADKMGAALKQPFVVDNRAGAAGAIAAEAAARSPADGYTLFACTSTTQVMLPLITSKLPYDAAKDFVSVGIISKADNLVLVPATSPFKTINDLIAFGKANPGKLSYGTAGIGTTHHLAAERRR
jgi:tripartite-type tricarboxylate transporter receptor subunit TctC